MLESCFFRNRPIFKGTRYKIDKKMIITNNQLSKKIVSTGNCCHQSILYSEQNSDTINRRVSGIAYKNGFLENRLLKTWQFKNAVKKLQNTIAVGNLIKNTVTLNPDYWLEALGMKLVVDGNSFQGQIYTGYIASEYRCLEKWKLESDENLMKIGFDFANYILLKTIRT